MIDHSIYLHIPFCQKRCAYCDFNTWAGKGQLIPAYVEALCKEVRGVAASSPERIPVKSIYFGGGTPSLLDADQLQKIFDALRQGFDNSSLANASLAYQHCAVMVTAAKNLD